MNVFNVFFVDLMKEIKFLAVPILFLFFLAVLVPTNSFGSTGILCVMVWLLWREPEHRSRWWKLAWPWLLAVLVYFVIMSTYSFSAITALRDGVRVLEGIGLSVVALYLLQLSEHHLRRAVEYVVTILMAATIMIVFFNLYHVGFLELINNHGFDWYVNRNRIAVGFSVTAVFVLSLMIEERLRWKSVMWSGLLVFVCLAAALNGSRGAIVGMLASMICIVIAAVARHGWRKVIRIELLLLPFLSIFTALSCFYYQNISLVKFYIHDDGIDTGRFVIWQTILERLETSPWIGYGTHAIKQDTFLMHYGLASFTSPHSIYVGLLYASGLVGVFFWIVWFWTLTLKFRRHVQAHSNIAFYLGIGVLVNTLVHGLIDFDFYMLATMTFIVFGIVMMMPRLNVSKG